MAKPHLTSTKFSDLKLHDSLLESLEDNGYQNCTSIQALALPKLLEGKDITGQAQTGTGKTASFLLATLNHLMTTPVERNKKGPYALIMAPTRELALQIYDDAKMLGAYTGLKYALLYGGAGYGAQKRQLEDNADIVIGTVGRILDFHKQHQLDLRNIEVLVLDEADRMFDLGFISDVRYLMRKMPPAEKRLNMLFSATFSQRVLELAYEHMNDPETVQVEPEQVTGERIEQSLYHVASDEKIALLLGLLKREAPERTIIFANTRYSVDNIANYLEANGHPTAALSGDVPQNRREALLEEFKEGKRRVMVATDVAARGLHISDVTHVINYDLPQDVEDYVHRIGRTARAGERGKAISFACEEYVYSLPDIEEYIKAEIPVLVIEDDLLITPEKPSREAVRNRRGEGNRRNTQNNRNQKQGSAQNNRRRVRRPRPKVAEGERVEEPNGAEGEAKGEEQNRTPRRNNRRRPNNRNRRPNNRTPQKGGEGEGQTPKSDE